MKNLPNCGPKRGVVSGEAHASRVRRESLAKLVSGSCNGDLATAKKAIHKAKDMWGAKQALELDKRNSLAKKRRLDAILHGSCIPGDDDDTAEVVNYGLRRKKQRLQVLHRYTVENVIPKAPDHNVPAGSRVYVDPLLDNICRVDIQNAISRLRWRQVDDRALAQVLVVSDPARPDAKDAFVAALGGRLLVSLDFVKKGINHGVAIQYERALRLPRYLWVSPSCEVRFAAALQVMRRMWQHSGTGDEPHTRWKFDTSDEFLARRGRGSRTGQQELVALVLASELTDRNFRQYPGRTTLSDFIKRCTRISRLGCQAGVLGR